MAFAAPHLGFRDILLRFFTKCLDLNPALEQCHERPGNSCIQFHVLAGIRPGDGWHGAGAAKVPGPGLALSHEQTAFLHVPTAKVITVKMRAFLA
ncbi:MAG: hypothetical protein JETCAE01_30540 [Anaerolineaceae bacterium]|nr:MAG: hypothetical protein JETCAE01_30540 [Anaerolineaceae bacterium]